MRLIATLVAIVAGVAFASHGSVEFAAPFADGCVLQRGVPVPVWGRADPGEKVEVTFGGQSIGTTAGADGRWMVHLAPMEACSEGRVLSANDRQVKDVLVGEVWLCAGQSNAEMPLCGGSPRYRDRTGALVAAMTCKPLVRFASMSSEPWSDKPRTVLSKPVSWKPFTPENLGMPGGGFSAMGVYFALELHSALNVPVGIIGAYKGSTPIEAWIPPEAFVRRAELNDYPAYPPVSAENWNSSMTNRFVRYGGFQQPCAMWNARVAPLVPYAIKGVIWYQGCSNQWNPERYLELQHALYDSWAAAFENPELPFRFVQVAAWKWNKTLPIQLAQAQFAKEEKNAAMVVISDIGNLSDAHPNEKGLVGRRLAALALARDYGYTGIRADSPTLREWHIEGSEVVLVFDNARSLYLYNADGSLDSTFEIAGADGRWTRAEIVNAERKGPSRGSFPSNEIRLTAPGVASPAGVRYLHCPPFTGNIFNEMNLPLGVFSTESSDGKDAVLE